MEPWLYTLNSERKERYKPGVGAAENSATMTSGGEGDDTSAVAGRRERLKRPVEVEREEEGASAGGVTSKQAKLLASINHHDVSKLFTRHLNCLDCDMNWREELFGAYE